MNFAFWSLSLPLIIVGCAPASKLATVCATGTSANGNSLMLQSSSIENIFLDNWNGLTGVAAGLNYGVPTYCKAFVEVAPARQGESQSRTFLWSQPDCRLFDDPVLYLAFKNGYLSTQVKRKLLLTVPNKFEGNSTLNDIYRTKFPISSLFKRQYGPWENSNRTSDTYDFLGHIVEEIEFVPSEKQLVNDFLKIVLDAQVERRARLIPADAESALSDFRGFFSHERIVKRLLLQHSTLQSIGGYRYCSAGVWTDTPLCQSTAQVLTDKLSSSLQPEFWNGISRHYFPTNEDFDFVAYQTQERSVLNAAIRSLFRKELLMARVPHELSAELKPKPAGIKSVFTDSLFSLFSESVLAGETSPLVLSETPHSTGFLQVSGLQPADFCSQLNHVYFRKPYLFSLDGEIEEAFLEHGSALVSIAGLVPLARKRPQCAVCEEPGYPQFSDICSSAGGSSGGASVLSLPAFREEDTISDSLMSEAVATARQNGSGESQTASEQQSTTSQQPAGGVSTVKCVL